MADAPDSKPGPFGGIGSSPMRATKFMKIKLQDVYEYTKHWFDEHGREQMPTYRCRFCLQEAQRPNPVIHLHTCEAEIV